MQKSEDLTKKLTELKKAIKANSVDNKLATKLISDILSVKGQLSVEPLPISSVGDELGVFKGDTFTITKYEKAVIFHVYNGIDLVVRPEDRALYETLVDYVDNQDEYNKLDGELKERFDLNLSATVYVLSIPRFAFIDAEFCYDIATKVVEFLRKRMETIDEMELQDETFEEDKEFEKGAMALEELKDMAKD